MSRRLFFCQQKPDDTIEIDLDLDELDATSAELKATYQEIKDYVLKEFGLKVSSLFISQVKRKCAFHVLFLLEISDVLRSSQNISGQP